jgi:hypothetical protein
VSANLGVGQRVGHFGKSLARKSEGGNPFLDWREKKFEGLDKQENAPKALKQPISTCSGHFFVTFCGGFFCIFCPFGAFVVDLFT